MDQVLQIDPPLRGIWKALRSPGHHRFAYDFAAAKEDGKLFSVSGMRLMIGKTAVENSFAQPFAHGSIRLKRIQGPAGYLCW